MATQDGDFVTAEGLAEAFGTAGGNALSAYPIGSIYLSVSDTSPSTLFGGTWERIQDRFLLCAGATYAAGSTGGEATHKLTIDEMPSHSHGVIVDKGGAKSTPSLQAVGGKTTRAQTTNVGGNAAHNNMPPYLAVYVWKRTA